MTHGRTMCCARRCQPRSPTPSLRAQLHRALGSMWFMCGDAARARAEADTVLATPGLRERIDAAAAQSRLLALMPQDAAVSADQLTPSDGEAGAPPALTTLAAFPRGRPAVGTISSRS